MTLLKTSCYPGLVQVTGELDTTREWCSLLLIIVEIQPDYFDVRYCVACANTVQTNLCRDKYVLA